MFKFLKEKRSSITTDIKAFMNAAVNKCAQLKDSVPIFKSPKSFTPHIDISVFCPVIPCAMHIKCAELENAGQFTIFVLYACGKGYEPSRIAETINLRLDTVLEEIEWLKNTGYVDNSCRLTETGSSLFNIIEYVRSFNKSEHLVWLNCFTGSIEDCSNMPLTTDMAKSACLPAIVNINHCKIWNYLPLLTYLKSARSHDHEYPNHFEYKIDPYGEIVYAQYFLKSRKPNDFCQFVASYECFDIFTESINTALAQSKHLSDTFPTIACDFIDNDNTKSATIKAGPSKIVDRTLQKLHIDPLGGLGQNPDAATDELPKVRLLLNENVESNYIQYLAENDVNDGSTRILDIKKSESSRILSFSCFGRR